MPRVQRPLHRDTCMRHSDVSHFRKSEVQPLKLLEVFKQGQVAVIRRGSHEHDCDHRGVWLESRCTLPPSFSTAAIASSTACFSFVGAVVGRDASLSLEPEAFVVALGAAASTMNTDPSIGMMFINNLPLGFLTACCCILSVCFSSLSTRVSELMSWPRRRHGPVERLMQPVDVTQNQATFICDCNRCGPSRMQSQEIRQADGSSVCNRQSQITKRSQKHPPSCPLRPKPTRRPR